MSNSYRIRTTPGINKNITVSIDQDFEYLEILSLKIVQQDLYIRTCSDYGVVIGRISINNGFGLPNVKVSVFIPLSDEDSTNPLISTIYPYKTVSDINEDGYRYNLLPYTKSHTNHTPTGTFFDRVDVLTDSTLIEVYDKYYKYTTTTNDSGDFMIFGVPTGQQTLFVDCDLSDIGEFSLVPNDLIRTGIATEDMVDKNKFKSSNNLNTLPQIISFSRNIEVAPLWGEPELCSLGITRTDFDLSETANIDIRPTAVFMGSIISTIDDTTIEDDCAPNKKLGELCSLSTGPGQIRAIRQTIDFDIDGRPVLEVFELQNAGQVIDESGTWLLDLPMNLDYVITNEFGEQVISSDPTQGIPTKGKYRFKIKWNQPPDLRDPVKRGYYLVPNVREYGWNDGSEKNPVNPADVQRSYAFSLNWDDYGDKTTPFGLTMIDDAINCKDKFYEFKYNKVYTVSNLITQYRKGFNRRRFVAIKNILDEQCESENNKFPSNDAQQRTDIIFLLFTILLVLMYPVINTVMILMHIISFIVVVVLQPLLVLFAAQFAVAATIEGIGAVAAFIPPGAPGLGAVHAAKSVGYLALVAGCVVLIVQIQKIKKYFQNFTLANLTYPDCELCNCDAPSATDTETIAAQSNTGNQSNKVPTNNNGTALLTPFTNGGLWTMYGAQDLKTSIFSGMEIPLQGAIGDGVGTSCLCLYEKKNDTECNQLPRYSVLDNGGDEDDIKINPWSYMSTDIPFPDRINLFNVKAKYFQNTTPNVNFNGGISQANGGKGTNQIKVRFDTDLNPSPSVYHLDNVLVIFINSDLASEMTPGRIMTFQDTKKSNDINFTGFSENDYGTQSITGTSSLTSGSPSSVTVKWANPSGQNQGSNNTTVYNLTGTSFNNGNMFQAFPFDIEYYQIITAMTYSDYAAKNVTQLQNSFHQRYIKSNFYNIRIKGYGGLCMDSDQDYYSLWSQANFDKVNEQIVVFLVRGVDPHSTRTKCEYDLSKLFGYSSFGNVVVNGDNGKIKYKLNIPIQGGPKNVKHYGFTNGNTDPYSGQYLFHPTFQFKPNPAEFKPFDTTLTTKYSALDNTEHWPNGNAGTQIDNNNGVRVGAAIRGTQNSSKGAKGGLNNHYLFRYDDSRDGGQYYLCGYYVSSANKGYNYYQYENVEGGSFLTIYNIRLDSPDSLEAGKCDDDDWQCAVTNYVCPKNSTSFKINDSTRLVMRGDRLPLSTYDYNPNGGNSYRPLHANPIFEVILLDDTGESAGSSIGPVGAGDGDGALDGIGASLQCSGLAPLTCYDNTNGVTTVSPKTDSCWQNGINSELIMKKGCYILVTVPLLSIAKDYILLAEWKSRMITNFAACRNVFAHVFTNNWVNGTLFAFPFDMITNYNDQNDPIPSFCTQMFYLDNTNNNIYYRSSRYSYNGYFVGAGRPQGVREGNNRNLMYPTTIMDLGPRDLYIQEVSVTDDYDGYIVDKLRPTTFNDVSALLSLLLITRLTNKGFWSNLANMSVNRYFPRENDFISGDYAQMNSINSEFSIVPYKSSAYQNPVNTYQSTSDDDKVFGIFFNNDQQNRDYISPKRSIITNIGPINKIDCAFDDIPFKTQNVPFYLWGIKENEDADNIFGSQKNEWYTSILDNGKMFDFEYQRLDRVLSNSKYFRTTNTSVTDSFRSYIYSVGTAVDSKNIPIPSGDISTWQQSVPNPRAINTGAPFFFYFGLKKGSSAFDKFSRVWLDYENVE